MPRNHKHRFYLAADDGSGASTGSGGAILDGPIQPSGGADFDPSTYTPPSDADISDFVLGPDDAEAPVGVITPKTETPKPEEPKEKKEEPPKEEPKKEEPKQKEPPAAQLRKRLGELEAQNAELQKQMETAKSDKRVEELTEKLRANEAAIKAKEEQIAATERKLMAHNPHVSKRLNEMRDKFNADFAEVEQLVPNLRQNYGTLLDEYQAIRADTANFAEKTREFREKLRDTYDIDADTVFAAVRKGVQFRADYAKAGQEVQSEAEKIIFQEERAQWEKNYKRVESEWNKWFEPPADAETNDPFNALHFLKRFHAEAMPAEEVTRVTKTVQDWVKNVFAGAQPRTKDDFPGMTDEQIAQERQAIESRVMQARDQAPQIVSRALMLSSAMPALIREISRLRSRLKEKEESIPPDPTRNDGMSQRRQSSSGYSLQDIDLSSPEDIERSVMRG